MDKLKKIIRDSFGFSERESNGFIILSGLLIFTLAFPWGYRWYLLRFAEKEDPGNPNLFFEVSRSHEDSKKYYRQDSSKAEYSVFDPNTVSLTELQKLGLEQTLAERVINFREAGGRFRKKEDILRIYNFPEELYHKLEPYIAIKKSESDSASNRSNSTIQKRDSRLNLNTAGKEDLVAISGIGDVLAGRIIKFRDKLGGFVDLNQVYQVFGLDSVVAQRLLKVSFIQPDFVPQKLLINLSSEEMLDGHPYCNKKAAKIIVAYRANYGHFKSLNNLASSKAFTDDELQKIGPYLSFE